MDSSRADRLGQLQQEHLIVQRLREKKEEVELMLASLRFKCAELGRQKQQNQRLRASVNQLTTLKLAFQQKEAENMTLAEQLASLTAECECLNSKVQQQRLSQRQRQHKQFTTEIRKQAVKVNILKQTQTHLKRLLKEFTTRAELNSNKLQIQQKCYLGMRDALVKQIQQVERRQQGLSNTSRQLWQSLGMKDRARLEQQAAKLKAGLADLEEQRQLLSKNVQNVRGQLRRIKLHVHKLDEQHQTKALLLQTRKQDLLSRLEELQEQLDVSQQAKAGLQNQLEQGQSDNQLLDLELRKLKLELEAREKSLEQGEKTLRFIKEEEERRREEQRRRKEEREPQPEVETALAQLREEKEGLGRGLRELLGRGREC